MNEAVLRVVGMSRSGNHAIIDWILNQHPRDWLFLNCTEPSASPYDTARPLWPDGPSYRTDISGLDLDAEREGRFRAKSLLVYSHEDTFLKRACGAHANRVELQFLGRAARRADVLVLRDPFNLFASRRRSCTGLADATAKRIWKQHAKWFLAPPRSAAREFIPINYNRWCRSPAYRWLLADRLGLRFTDCGVDEVPAVANGSSFDGLAYRGRASEMTVLERWRSYADDPAFAALFDNETRALSRRIFGALPAEDRLAL